MTRAVGYALAVGLLAICSGAHAASSLSCTERFRAAGIDPAKLSPGDRGRLEGHEFIVAKDDVSAQKICDRIDAEKERVESLQAQLNSANVQLSKAQDQIADLSAGGPIKRNYLIIDGCLLAWAVIASIWASYFAGRLAARRHPSY